MRIGFGVDFHKFGEGNYIMLCGIKVPHTRGIIAHSDGDVALHAITDAILGAICEGDIGSHFPNSDPRIKGADSIIFLRHALVLMEKHGFKVSNLDVTIICEEPHVSPYRDVMQTLLSKILSTKNINVKGTTSEEMGAMGRKEGISAMATVMLQSA